MATAFAATQAAYRFFNNPRVALRTLARPLIEAGREAVRTDCDRYVLAVHDWSSLKFRRKSANSDALPTDLRRGNYELYTTLLVSDRAGDALAPVAMSLHAADGVHCSRSPTIRAPLSPLDEIAPVMKFLARQRLDKPVVHLVDAQADSVWHYREWSKCPERFFLVRADDRLVEYDNAEFKCSQLQQQGREQGQFKYTRAIRFRNQPAEQWVAEFAVRLTRSGQLQRGGKRTWFAGPPIALRLIVAEARSPDGRVLATWYLLSNVPSDVDTGTLALWYYWRWNIESYFKLLKSAGMNLEQWEQETAPAIVRRLMVASMACVVVWHAARSTHPKAAEARNVLIRLSGRQMKHHKQFTQPALLAGLWMLLAMLDTLEHYNLDQLREIAAIMLPHNRAGPASEVV